MQEQETKRMTTAHMTLDRHTLLAYSQIASVLLIMAAFLIASVVGPNWFKATVFMVGAAVAFPAVMERIVIALAYWWHHKQRT